MKDHAAEVKIGGGVVLTGLSALTLNEWLIIVSIIYFVLQIGLLIPKYHALVCAWMNKRRDKKKKRG